jgi:hypothetical protein
MGRVHVKEIAGCPNDVHEDICEGEASPMQLTEPHPVIKLLMDETAKARDQVLPASLEYRARRYKQTIEEQFGVRN